MNPLVLAWNDEGATRPYAPREASGNRRPREMATQTQNPAYRVASQKESPRVVRRAGLFWHFCSTSGTGRTRLSMRVIFNVKPLYYSIPPNHITRPASYRSRGDGGGTLRFEQAFRQKPEGQDAA